MDALRSWLFRGKAPPHPVQDCDNEKDGPKVDLQKSESKYQIVGQDKQVNIGASVDPVVAEYFKDFPEPYKTKAVSRFSSREGLYQWDIFRNLAMKREFESASRGVFLEDDRERYEQLKAREQSFRERLNTEVTENDFESREYSSLEKSIRTYIPVHKDETLGQKLFQTFNFSFLGIVLVWSTVRLRKRKPTISRWQHYMAFGGSSCICVYLHIAAFDRLMDLGPFDRSVDNRDALTKQFEDMNEFFSSLAKDVKHWTGKNES